jgi:hypothetical protein
MEDFSFEDIKSGLLAEVSNAEATPDPNGSSTDDISTDEIIQEDQEGTVDVDEPEEVNETEGERFAEETPEVKQVTTKEPKKTEERFFEVPGNGVIHKLDEQSLIKQASKGFGMDEAFRLNGAMKRELASAATPDELKRVFTKYGLGVPGFIEKIPPKQSPFSKLSREDYYQSDDRKDYVTDEDFIQAQRSNDRVEAQLKAYDEQQREIERLNRDFQEMARARQEEKRIEERNRFINDYKSVAGKYNLDPNVDISNPMTNRHLELVYTQMLNKYNNGHNISMEEVMSELSGIKKDLSVEDVIKNQTLNEKLKNYYQTQLSQEKEGKKSARRSVLGGAKKEPQQIDVEDSLEDLIEQNGGNFEKAMRVALTQMGGR